MHVVGDVAQLDHLEHVFVLFACAAHVKIVGGCASPRRHADPSNYPKERNAGGVRILERLVTYQVLPHRIEYSPAAVGNLRALAVGQQRTVLDSVDEQYQPALETRNRKPMRPNPIAPWELRIGVLCAFYEIKAAESVVRILAVGVKERDVVRTGGEVIRL